MTLTEIEEKIRDAKDSPHALADLRVELSAEFIHRTEEMKHVLRLKPSVWMDMRQNHKSDTATDRAFDATDLGQHEMELRYDLKSLEKSMSAIRGLLDVFNAEARNLM